MHELLPLATRSANVSSSAKKPLAIAESSSGGLLSAVLLAVPGASAYFWVARSSTLPRRACC